MPKTSQRRLKLSIKPSSIRTYSRQISTLSGLSLIPRCNSERAVDGET